MTVATKPLGIHTKSASALRLEARARRYSLQRVAGKLLPQERVAWCSQRVTLPALEIRKSGEKAYYHGLAVCGSAWTCPVCASRISEQRRLELKRASLGTRSLILVTVTLQHSREDKLEELLEALNSAWRSTRSGRAWMRMEEHYRIATSVSSLEITYSQEAGYHPHRHILFWSDTPEEELDIRSFEQELSERWRSQLAKRGRWGSEYYSLRAEIGVKPVAEYLSKWGASEELTKSTNKQGKNGHYSMWEVLEKAGAGEIWAVMAFKEYALATKGKRLLSWSRGARALLGLEEEKTDEEIAQSEPPEDKSELVCTIAKCEWYEVCKREQRAHLLEIAEQEGSPGVEHYLERLREEATGGESNR